MAALRPRQLRIRRVENRSPPKGRSTPDARVYRHIGRIIRIRAYTLCRESRRHVHSTLHIRGEEEIRIEGPERRKAINLIRLGDPTASFGRRAFPLLGDSPLWFQSRKTDKLVAMTSPPLGVTLSEEMLFRDQIKAMIAARRPRSTGAPKRTPSPKARSLVVRSRRCCCSRFTGLQIRECSTVRWV